MNFNQLLLDARNDIFVLCKILNFVPTEQQAELFRAVMFHTFAPVAKRKKGVACKSGQGPGKTAASTIVAIWRTLQNINETTLVTAPTMRQVRDVWISELNKTIARAVPEFQRLVNVTATKAVFCGMQDWIIKTATSTKPENLQGYHNPGLTVLLDEASGIGRPIWQTVKGTLTQPDNLLVAIGNPNDRNTEFFDMFNKDADLYHTLTWSAEDSPNVSKKHIADMEEEYGRDSDVFRVRVLGEFPRQNPNAVIVYEDLLYCAERVSFDRAFANFAPGERQNTRQFGIDYARFGSDESVITARYNCAVVGQRHFSKYEPADVNRKAFEWQRSLGWTNQNTTFCVDAGGMGQGVLNMFYETGRNVFEFHAQGTPMDTERFHDQATEAYFVLRNLTRERRLHMKYDGQAFSQLVQRIYRYNNKNKFQIESKDEFLKRVGTEEFSSPDRADSTAMAFYPFASGLVNYFAT